MKWPSRVRIYHLTRDTNFLWKVVLSILGICTLLSIGAGKIGARDQNAIAFEAIDRLDDKQPSRLIEELLRTAPFATVIRLVAVLSGWNAGDEFVQQQPDVEKSIAASGLSDKEKQLAIAVWKSFMLKNPTAELERIAAERPVRRYANEMLGQLLHDRDIVRAAAAYEAEGREFPDASYSRAMAIKSYLDAGRTDDVARLMQESSFLEAVDTGTAMKIALERGEWIRFPWILLEREWHDRSPVAIAMVAISGLIWLVIGLQLAQAPLFSTRTLICLLSAVLGYFSTIAVLIAGFFKRDLDGFRESGNLIGDLVFYTVGVGVPEEVLKFAFFLPLVPWLVWRKQPLEMLMAAGFAGLGFGIGENLNYVESTGTATALGRFLTANFLHLAWTGIIGGAFCQMFYYRRGPEHFLTQLILAILLHGTYDAAATARSEFSFFAIVLIIGSAYLFFHQLRHDRPAARETVSPVATFAFGSALLVGMAMILASYQLGFVDGWTSAGMGALSIAVLNVMFVRELGRL